ncbi:ABC transporter substrate-binding protein [Robertmurraya massiliosenegalensis]|uniref:ABC transporter substrate-binding protein n=1 Tax=Robertmurraya massiliosenegalensis TaxID=1287657 RepID=UPI0002E5356A|nr:ABC transporter substrate-binding protein [Robertmurraya massiliosenegalensis]
MKTKWFLFFLIIFTLSFILYSFFSFDKEVHFKVGILMAGEERNEKYNGLKSGLEDLGYDLNQFDFIVKSADNTISLEKKIKELLETDLNLIVTLGGIETTELKREMERRGENVPVVFAGVAAPMEMGIINDYQKPGGNFTGINNYHTSLSGKRLELLCELIPSIERVLIFYDPDVVVSKLSLQKIEEAADVLSITLKLFDITNPNYKKEIENTTRENDAILILPSFRIESLTGEITALSYNYHIPVMGIYENEVKAGYTASYGTSFFEQGYQSARFVSSVLQGNSPSQIPIELPDTVRFLINREVVEDLNISIDANLINIAEFINQVERDEKK